MSVVDIFKSQFRTLKLTLYRPHANDVIAVDPRSHVSACNLAVFSIQFQCTRGKKMVRSVVIAERRTAA